MMPRCRHFGGMLVLTSLLSAGCREQTPAPAKPAPPKFVKEGQLNLMELTDKQESHLKLKIVKVESRSMPLQRSYGGEITLPSSAIFKVPAPVTGTLELTKGAKMPAVGAVVNQGQPLVTLV